MGPDPAPLVPDYDFLNERGYKQIIYTDVPCNWFQCQENSIDPVHVEWLHGRWTKVLNPDGGVPGLEPKAHKKDGFDEFEWGLQYHRVFEGDTAALGFDLYSEDVRRAALIQAWESGKLTITEPITLVQETGSHSAFLFYSPVDSSKDIPATLQERRALLEGFRLAVIRLGHLITGAVPSSPLHNPYIRGVARQSL